MVQAHIGWLSPEQLCHVPFKRVEQCWVTKVVIVDAQYTLNELGVDLLMCGVENTLLDAFV